jgi:uncharacterized membrane protein SpoIIM required for sporulation
MREALFIKQNSERWKQCESLQTHDPDELAERFIAITDDLAYAKTFYPQSKTTAYLNKKYHRELLYSFVFFMAFFLVGVISAKYDTGFVRFFFGDGYVNMTNENIAKGDPFGVYKDPDQFTMFYHIASNNLYVTVLNYLAGIFVSIGAVCLTARNGIMLGVFEYFFFSKGLGAQSILVIWIHGTLEISSIIIAGGAGLVFGNSIIFPKTYTRLESFKRGAMDGLKITIGVLPIIVVAATFESFVTRHTGMPLWLSISILAGSLSFIIWYVILYPIYLSRNLKSLKYNNAAKS